MGSAVSTTINDNNALLSSEQVKQIVGEHYNDEKFNELAVDGTIPASKILELIESHTNVSNGSNGSNGSNSRRNSSNSIGNSSHTKGKNVNSINSKNVDPKIVNAEKNVFKEHNELKNLKRKSMALARNAAREAIEIARKIKEEEDRIAAEKLAEELATVAVQKKDDDDDDEGDEDDDEEDDDDEDDDDSNEDNDDEKKKKKKKKKGEKEEKKVEEIIDPPNKLPPILEGVVISEDYKALIAAKELVLKDAIEQFNAIAPEKFKYSDDFIAKDFIDDFFYELDRNDRDPNDIINMLHADCALSINTQSLVLKTSEVVAMGFANMFRGLNVKHEIVKVTLDKDPLPKFVAQLSVKVNIKIETDNSKLTLELIDLVKPPSDSIGHTLGLPFLIANIKLINQDARPLYCLPEIAIPKTENDNWEPQFKPIPPELTPEELEALAAAEEKKRLKREKAEEKLRRELEENEEGGDEEENEEEGDEEEGDVEGNILEGGEGDVEAEVIDDEKPIDIEPDEAQD